MQSNNYTAKNNARIWTSEEIAKLYTIGKVLMRACTGVPESKVMAFEVKFSSISIDFILTFHQIKSSHVTPGEKF